MSMPVFKIKAKDALAVEAIEAYRDLCVRESLTDQAGQVDLAIGEIEDWQAMHPGRVKLPDHVHMPMPAAVECTEDLTTRTRRLFSKAFGMLVRVNERTGPHLHWVMCADDLNDLRTMAASYTNSSAITEWPDPLDKTALSRLELLGVKVEVSEDAAPGSLALVIEPR